jgi:hypothetical protein
VLPHPPHELHLIHRGHRARPDLAGQADPSRLAPLLPLRDLGVGLAVSLRPQSESSGVQRGQPVRAFQLAAGRLRQGVVIADEHLGAILAHPRRRDVDVIVAGLAQPVPHRHPPRRCLSRRRRESHGVHVVLRDRRPLRIGQLPGVRAQRQRAVPHIAPRHLPRRATHGRSPDLAISTAAARSSSLSSHQAMIAGSPPTRWGSVCSFARPGPTRNPSPAGGPILRG